MTGAGNQCCFLPGNTFQTIVEEEEVKMSPAECLSSENRHKNLGRLGQVKFAWQSIRNERSIQAKKKKKKRSRVL